MLILQHQILIYLSNRIKYNAPKRINAWGQNFYMGIRLTFMGDFLCSEEKMLNFRKKIAERLEIFFKIV